MVYVDDHRVRWRGMIMSHLFADTDAELMEFARRLGLKPEYKHNEHFDVSETKRDLALELGAKPISYREMAMMVCKKRHPEVHKKYMENNNED